jgi:hypothetical protein
MVAEAGTRILEMQARRGGTLPWVVGDRGGGLGRQEGGQRRNGISHKLALFVPPGRPYSKASLAARVRWEVVVSESQPRCGEASRETLVWPAGGPSSAKDQKNIIRPRAVAQIAPHFPGSMRAHGSLADDPDANAAAREGLRGFAVGAARVRLGAPSPPFREDFFMSGGLLMRQRAVWRPPRRPWPRGEPHVPSLS